MARPDDPAARLMQAAKNTSGVNTVVDGIEYEVTDYDAWMLDPIVDDDSQQDERGRFAHDVAGTDYRERRLYTCYLITPRDNGRSHMRTLITTYLEELFDHVIDEGEGGLYEVVRKPFFPMNLGNDEVLTCSMQIQVYRQAQYVK